jgi:hypothetical protein
MSQAYVFDIAENFKDCAVLSSLNSAVAFQIGAIPAHDLSRFDDFKNAINDCLSASEGLEVRKKNVSAVGVA